MAHLGLLAPAQDAFVSESELSEYYLILKGYYSGSAHVCLREGTNTRCKSSNYQAILHLWDPCNGILLVLLLFYQC